MSSKQLDSLPPRILRFRLCLMRYHFNIKHVPGKLMYTADTLSRASTSVPGTDCEVLQDDAERFAAQAIAHLPASKARMEVYRHLKLVIQLRLLSLSTVVLAGQKNIDYNLNYVYTGV